VTDIEIALTIGGLVVGTALVVVQVVRSRNRPSDPDS
jgi:hypothetical protein